MPESKSPRDPESAAAQRWQDSSLGLQGQATQALMSLVPKGLSECRKPAGGPRAEVEDDYSPTSIACEVPQNHD